MPSTNLRILMLSPHPGAKGPIPKHTPLLIEGLEKLGCRVTRMDWGRHGENETVGEKLTGRIRDVLGVRRALGSDPYDLLIVKTAHDRATLFRDIPLLMAAKGRVRHKVLQFHGSDPGALANKSSTHPFRVATARLMALADGSLVLSREEKRAWEKVFPGRRFFPVKNPYVRSPLLQEPRPEPVAAGKEMELLFTGRIMPEKGIFDLVEAFERISGSHPCRLTIAGDGPSREALAEDVARRGLGERIRLTGYLRGDDLVRAYRQADLFVLPTYYIEGFPTSITEAMQARLPIVTTPTRGAADHLTDGVHALFVPARDPAALATALDRLLSDPGLMRTMGVANFKNLESFSPEVVAQEYLAALNAILNGV